MVAISLVIPVYNIEKYLEECLDSLINQTFKDFEVICVNDGSKDSSLEILNEYAQKDIRFKVISQENGGSGSARNNGLNHAQGKYVQFLDGDDYFEPEMLEKLYNLAEKHQADIAVCSSRKVDDEGNITETRNPNSPLNLNLIPFNKPFNYTDFPDDIFTLTGTAPWNKLYLREMLVKNNLGFPKLTGPDDLCFVHSAIVCAEKIVAIDDEFINYRYNRPGSVQTYRANHTIDIIRAFLFIKEFLVSKNVFETVKKAYEQASIFSIRWEIGLCNDEQYETFLNQLKKEFPNDWKDFEFALRKDYITLDYLYNFIGAKKVYLWGASNFLKNLLANEKEANPNILGIIDRNEASWGKNIGNYKIYSPKVLENVENIGVLITIYNNHEQAHKAIKEDLEILNPFIEVLDNIFKLNIYNEKIRQLASNKLFLVDSFGQKHLVTHIKGLEINWLGSNSTIEIEATPMINFKNTIINCGSNCLIKIGFSKYHIKNLFADITATNSELIIGSNFLLDGGDILMRSDKNMKILIGNDCLFSKDIYIRSNDSHTIYDLKNRKATNKPENIEIKNHVWLCQNVTVLKGAKINDNTVVANSSLVNKSFNESNIVLAGTPAKIIRRDCNWNRKSNDKFESVV